MEYEKAALFRDQIRAIMSVQQRQNIVAKDGDFDVIGLARDGGHSAIEIFYVRYGKMIGKEISIFPKARKNLMRILLPRSLRISMEPMRVLSLKVSWFPYCRQSRNCWKHGFLKEEAATWRWLCRNVDLNVD